MINLKLPLLELQKAIFNRLNRNISCEVYDNIDLDAEGKLVAQFPFIRLGENTVIDDGTKTDDRTNVTFTINVFSQHPSQTEVKKILNEVVEQITSTPLTLSGFSVMKTKVELIRTYQEFENTKSNSKMTIIQCGVVIFRFKIVENH